MAQKFLMIIAKVDGGSLNLNTMKLFDWFQWPGFHMAPGASQR